MKLIRRVAPLVLTASVTMAAASCGGGDTVGPSTTGRSTGSTEPVPSTTTDPLEGAEVEVSRAYDRWRLGVRKLFEDPDPNSPLVEDFYEGPLQESVRERLAEQLAKGWTSPPRPDDQSEWAPITITVESPAEAVVVDCYVNGGWVISPNGEVVDDEIYTFSSSIRFVEGEDGVWRAAAVDALSRQDGRTGCAEAL